MDEEQEFRALILGAAFVNNSREMPQCMVSTGLRTASLKHRGLSEPGNERLAEDFLLNTRLLRSDSEAEVSAATYFSDVSAVLLSQNDREIECGYEEIVLPQSLQLSLRLGHAIDNRRSVRQFTGDTIELPFLATILNHCSGITGKAETEVLGVRPVEIALRATPSGGGLYPVDTYIAVINVDHVSPGIYRYQPLRNVVQRLAGREGVDAIIRAAAAPPELLSLNAANAVILLVGRPWRSMRKYGRRGLRFLFLEAGAIAQTINLVAVALGLGTVDCGSFFDDEVHDVLGVDGLHESLLHTVVIGSRGAS
jgi:SagB-type dehydrogenase family enzyme